MYEFPYQFLRILYTNRSCTSTYISFRAFNNLICIKMDSATDIRAFNIKKANSSAAQELNVGTAAVKPEDNDGSKHIYYDMSGDKYLIIFNHFQFEKRKNGEQPTERIGTAADVTSLSNLFENLGFKVTLHQDLKYDQIMDVIQEVICADHKNTSCIIVTVLTHGHEAGYVEANDKEYLLQEIHQKFVNSHNQHLVNKPKIFFIQACRGENVDKGKLAKDGVKIELEGTYLLPSHVDFLTVYSAAPGHISWRDCRGSFLIQELCKAIKTHPESDLLHIIALTNYAVAYHRASNNRRPVFHNKKQAIETHFTLTKLLKFY